MIGAPGLGRNVLAALQKADIGSGFVSGLALVILAIMIDRFIQYTNREKQHAHQKMPKKQKIALTSAVVIEGEIRKKYSIDQPMLTLIRQNGQKEKGWNGAPFYWPVISAQENIKTAMFSHAEALTKPKL